MKHVAVAVVALATLLASAGAWSRGGGYWGHGGHYHSHGSRVSLGFVFGGPLWYPAPVYGYPPAYYPPAIVVEPAPRVYIERDDRVARQSSPGYWYYCRESNTYYPYVKGCAGPWERVPAQPQDR
jgi:hypothetical protein